MTREQAKQLLPIIKAFSEGMVIETRTKPSVLNNPAIPNEWTELKELEYWGNNIEYRIKPQPTYRPFKDAEECWQEMQKHQPFGWVSKGTKFYVIDAVECNTVFIDDGCENRSLLAYFNDGFTFADGEPFGIKEEEE